MVDRQRRHVEDGEEENGRHGRSISNTSTTSTSSSSSPSSRTSRPQLTPGTKLARTRQHEKINGRPAHTKCFKGKVRLVNVVTRRHTKRIFYQKTQTQRALLERRSKTRDSSLASARLHRSALVIEELSSTGFANSRMRTPLHVHPRSPGSRPSLWRGLNEEFYLKKFKTKKLRGLEDQKSHFAQFELSSNCVRPHPFCVGVPTLLFNANCAPTARFEPFPDVLR